MSRYDNITGLLWFSFGIFVAAKAYSLGLGNTSNPGPGFIFFWSGILLCILSILIFFTAYRKKTEKEGKSFLGVGIRWGKIFVYALSLILYTYFLEKLGFIVSTLILLFSLFKWIEPQKWSIAIISTIISCVFVYSVFVLWLGCQLPKGIMPF